MRRGACGNIKATTRCPDTDEERLAFLADCQNVTLVRRLDVNRVLELESLIAAAAEPQMEDQAFGIRDYGLDTYSAVRYGSDGIVEIIPLAITGNRGGGESGA